MMKKLSEKADMALDQKKGLAEGGPKDRRADKKLVRKPAAKKKLRG